MTFRTITPEMLEPGGALGREIFFAPPPSSRDLPTVWLDLHVWDDHFQDCEGGAVPREFRTSSEGERYIKIGARQGVRLYTAEKVGTDRSHTAVVVNVASKAKHGLIVAPGKIDPGFSPERLVLVVFNQSRRSIRLRAGDKIASIGFANISEEAQLTQSQGHHNTALVDYEPARWQVLKTWLCTRDYGRLGFEVLKLILQAGLVLAIAWIGLKLGLRP